MSDVRKRKGEADGAEGKATNSDKSAAESVTKFPKAAADGSGSLCSWSTCAWSTAGVLLALALAAYGAWLVFSAPYYVPGSLASLEVVGHETRLPEAAFGSGPAKVFSNGSAIFAVSNITTLFSFNGAIATESTKPVMLVLHGGPSRPSHQPFAGLERFSKTHRVIYFDQRGCGFSTTYFEEIPGAADLRADQCHAVVESYYGLAANLADIERLRHLLGVKSMVLYGHSFGGFLAAMYALEYPDHVDGMVLGAPASVLLFPNEYGDLFAMVRETLGSDDRRAAYDAMLGRYMNFGDACSWLESERKAINNEFGAYYVEVVADLGWPSSEETFTEGNADLAGGLSAFGLFLSMGLRHDYQTPLKGLDSVPTLVLSGGIDFFDVRGITDYVDAIPGAEYTNVDGAGHSIHDDKPEVFGDRVEAFLAKNGL